jgi:serine protease Do
MTQMLQELQAAIAGAAERVGPAVVGLGRGWGRGSGVIVASGQVLTNAHVLRGDDVAVTFGDGDIAEGRVAGADPELDVAVIAVDTGAREPIRWEPDAVGALGPGTPVFALANPGGRGLRATFGLVSATGRSFRGPRGRRIGGSIEHSAPLPRGSSGGPLVDAQGRLLGIN